MKKLESFFKICTDLKDLIALMISNIIKRRLLPVARMFLPGLVVRLSETLGTWYLLNSLEGDDLLCVALIGCVLLLLFYLVCQCFFFVREKPAPLREIFLISFRENAYLYVKKSSKVPVKNQFFAWNFRQIYIRENITQYTWKKW